MTTNREVSSVYGDKLRVRVCGLLITEGKILLAQHKPFGPAGELWVPPGGGMNYLENHKKCLKREFLEETSLNVEVGELMFVNETINEPFHAIELFFNITNFSGTLNKGFDPEIKTENQILKSVKFISEEEINKFPIENLHNVFKCLKNKDGLISFDSMVKLKSHFYQNN